MTLPEFIAGPGLARGSGHFLRKCSLSENLKVSRNDFRMGKNILGEGTPGHFTPSFKQMTNGSRMIPSLELRDYMIFNMPRPQFHKSWAIPGSCPRLWETSGAEFLAQSKVPFPADGQDND